jgi:hypothetical protein
MKAWTASTRVPSASMLMIVASKGPVPLSATRTSSPTTGGLSLQITVGGPMMMMGDSLPGHHGRSVATIGGTRRPKSPSDGIGDPLLKHVAPVGLWSSMPFAQP